MMAGAGHLCKMLLCRFILYCNAVTALNVLHVSHVSHHYFGCLEAATEDETETNPVCLC